MNKLDSSENLETSRSIVSCRNICNNCLGRQFAHVSTGMTNRERGEIISKALGRKDTNECEICNGFFQNINRYADMALKKLKEIQYKSFVVGTIMSHGLIEREESLWEDVGIEYCETFKAESNRELGKILEKKTKKEVDEKNPDINVLLNLAKDVVEIRINPIFILGKYKKLVRGIPQTKWDKYKETVEDIIAKPFMSESGGSGHSLHASGREDIDAKCLDWRPFVFEVKNPKKRIIDLSDMRKKINISKKVEVSSLSRSDRKEVVRVKNLSPDKTYRVLVSFEKQLEERKLSIIKEVVGKIAQKTPSRVVHRRADKTRIRRVKSIKWRKINNKKLELVIKGEAGLYIKELVTGDNGRTKPSLAEIMNNPAKVEELDVVKIHLED